MIGLLLRGLGGKLLAGAKTLPWYVWTHLGAVLLGVWLGHEMSRPHPMAPDTAEPAARQADSSLVLQRAPDSTADPAHLIPKGDKLEREIRVVVQPTPALIAVRPIKDSAGNLSCPCTAAPVHLDLSLVRLPDLTRRVIASSPDGTVTGGIDIPVAPSPAAVQPLRWAVGAVYEVESKRWGGSVDRDLGPLRLSVTEMPAQRGFGNELLAGVKVRF